MGLNNVSVKVSTPVRVTASVDQPRVTVAVAPGVTGRQGIQGDTGDDGLIQSVVAGDNVTVDNSDPANPVISATGEGDVTGPASATDGRPALFDGATGKLLKQHGSALGTASAKDTGTSGDAVPLLNQSATFSSAVRFNGQFGIGRAGSAVGGMYFNRNPDNPFLLFSAGDPTATLTDLGQFRAGLSAGVIGITNGSGGVWGVAYSPSSSAVGILTSSPSTTLHVNGPIRCASYTVATVPAAGTVGAATQIYVSNESGGAVMAFSDGTNWRRVTDRAVIS